MTETIELVPPYPICVELTNRWAKFRCKPEDQVKLKPHFRYKKPGVEFSHAVRIGQWDGYTHLLKYGKVGAGLFLERRAELEQLGWQFAIEDLRAYPNLLSEIPPTDAARRHQIECAEAMWKTSNGGGIVIAATGTGKTWTSARFFQRLQGAGCFIVDELTLLEQAHEELQNVLGEPVGIIGGGDFTPRRICVATIQTLHRKRKLKEFQTWFKSLDVIIIDEFHLAMNKRNFDVIADADPKAVFGITATLEMEKPWIRLPAAAICGPVIYRYSIAEGIAEGHLTAGKILQLQFSGPKLSVAAGYAYTDINGRRIVVESGSAEAEYRQHVINNEERNDCIVRLVTEALRRNRITIVLCERLQHLKRLSNKLTANMVAHNVLCGAYSKEERREAQRRMNARELNLILASRIFAKGIDIKTLDCIIDATGMPNRNAVIQRYGRGTRMAEGKTDLWFIDIGDSGNRFSGAARVRRNALRELGEVELLRWEGNAAEIFDFLECQGEYVQEDSTQIDASPYN